MAGHRGINITVQNFSSTGSAPDIRCPNQSPVAALMFRQKGLKSSLQPRNSDALVDKTVQPFQVKSDSIRH